MNKKDNISEREKKLLTTIGKNAGLSYKEILSIVDYKRVEIIAKKIKKLRELDLIRGPYYDINLGAIGVNQIYNVYADIGLYPEDRDLVFEILKMIPGMRWIFPTQQEDKFFTQFQVNHYSTIGKLLSLLEKKKLISYQMAASKNRWIKMNPDFFGPPIPSSRTLLDPCNPPVISYAPVRKRIRWNKADLTFMQYLQVETDSKTEIRDTEYRKYGHFWTYGQIQNSVKKIKASSIIQSKDFHIAPYPRNKCCTFILLLSATRKKSLEAVLHNFGKGCRIHKSYTISGKAGFLFCWASPEIALEIIALFDEVDDITTNGLYYLRTHTGKYLYGSSFDPEMFDLKRQRWEFPYAQTKKVIEDLIKRDK